MRTLKTFQGTHILRASRGLLCDSSAVLFSSCCNVKVNKCRGAISQSANGSLSVPFSHNLYAIICNNMFLKHELWLLHEQFILITFTVYHIDHNLFFFVPESLADRILLLLHSVIGYWKNPVACLSVCLSVMLCIVALGVGVRGYKLYQCVPSGQVPRLFCPFRHFLGSRPMYCLATKRTVNKTAVLYQGEPRDAAVNFDTYRILFPCHSTVFLLVIHRRCDHNEQRYMQRSRSNEFF